MVTVAVVEVAPTANAGLALPCTVMICGEFAESSVSAMVSVRWPAASGAKATEILQEAVAASVAPEQLLGALLKSAALLPPIVTAEMCSGALPVLLAEILSGALEVPCVMVANAAGLGEMVATGAGGGGATPVPVYCTVCGPSGAVSVMLIEALCGPAPVGVNVTLMVQNLVGCKTEGT